jgi:hypothetical protein
MRGCFTAQGSEDAQATLEMNEEAAIDCTAIAINLRRLIWIIANPFQKTFEVPISTYNV